MSSSTAGGGGDGSTMAYMTLAIGGSSSGGGGVGLGTIRFRLHVDEVPRTCRNFLSLCQREEGSGYLGSRFHRIIPGFMAQGGDYERGDGTGGRSIYGPSFPDEDLRHTHGTHSRRGVLAMANTGPDTNGSQFYVTFGPTPHLDGRHVVFGCVDDDDGGEGSRVLDALEKVCTGAGDVPAMPVVVTDCGAVGDGETVVEDGGGTTAEEKKASSPPSLTGVDRAEAIRRKYLGGGGGDGDDGEEIDLDDDDDDGDEEEDGGGEDGGAGGSDADDSSDPRRLPQRQREGNVGGADDGDEIDVEEGGGDGDDGGTETGTGGEGGGVPSAAAPTPPARKMTPLQRRLHALKMKMNQSRALNRKEVLGEGERLGSAEGVRRERRRLAAEDKKRRERERAECNGKVAGEDAKFMTEQASESVRKANKKAAKAEANRYGVEDYYNPEGQHRHYERSLKSVPSDAVHDGSASSSAVFDPTSLQDVGGGASAGSGDGARRLAAELQRRAEKTKGGKRGRDVEFDASDVSYINQRNKRFNEKIGRNFDKHTAEIRQNLERGTAS